MTTAPRSSHAQRSALAVAVALAAAIVARADRSTHAQTAGASAEAPSPSAAPSARSPRTFGGVSEDHILEQIRTGRIVGRQQVGSTSINYHLQLAGEIDAAFKPRSRTHGEAYRAEIAAYRLNRLLGLNRVPPAITRVTTRALLRLPADSPVIVDRDESVRGAAIYWVPVLRDSRIDQERERARWSSWLTLRNAVPPEQAARAEEISSLLVFDFLTGNWDRWSGSNVPMDPAGHLVYRDNNGGFSEPFGPSMLANVLRQLRTVQRFSRGVIDRARAMTEATVRAEMALDGAPSHPPLNDTQLRSLLRRRDALVSYVDELVRRHGEAAVFPWP